MKHAAAVIWAKNELFNFKDDKPYAAFLSYHFSTESDKFAQEQVRYASAAVRDVLDGMGFRVYDEKRDGLNGCKYPPVTCSNMLVFILVGKIKYLHNVWTTVQ